MTSIPKRLKKEPLIEAIWLAQFEPATDQPIGDMLPGILYSRLKDSYPGLRLQRLPTADIPPLVAQLDPNLRFAAKYRMEEQGNPFMFQVGDRVITLNCRRPYAGWSTFREKILSLVEIIESSHLMPAPTRHSLRYIDLLTFDPAPDLKSLQVQFQIGQWSLNKHPIQMRVEIPDGECSHVIQIATPAEANLSDGRHQGTVIDLETLCSTQAGSWQDVCMQIDKIHDRSKAVFYQQLLTKEAIDLMEPEY